MRPICRNCEYFDCEGQNTTLLDISYRGDCLNPRAPGFQSGPDETCSHFLPDSTRWPSLAKGCCSAIEPCSHQRNDPTTICSVCQEANEHSLPFHDETMAGLASLTIRKDGPK